MYGSQSECGTRTRAAGSPLGRTGVLRPFLTRAPLLLALLLLSFAFLSVRPVLSAPAGAQTKPATTRANTPDKARVAGKASVKPARGTPDRAAGRTTVKSPKVTPDKAAGKASAKPARATPDRAARSTSAKPAKAAPKAGPQSSVRAHPWAFGGGKSAAAWDNRGMDGQDLYNNALPKRSETSARDARDKGPAVQAQSDHKARNSIDFSVDRQNDSWRVAPRGTERADEDVAMESQHRVRAFATVQEDNLSFGLGPEVYVRDRNMSNNALGTREDQPDVDAGLGMQFKLDF